MRLRIKTLLIRVATEEGLYGTKLSFGPGLCLIRASGNTKGKSTCVQAILYALGLEGMLSTRHEVPLTPAVTESIKIDDNRLLPVLESEVLLEVENGRGEIVTIRRPIAGNDDIKLITLWEGPVLSGRAKDFRKKDYFVRTPGGATRGAGFHKRLAEFVGWNLPEVPTISGKSVPLYIEAIMPLMFVEQKKGWGGIYPRFPGQFGIREVGRRAVEFLLSMDVYNLEVGREILKERALSVKNAWAEASARVGALAASLGGSVRDLPKYPMANWPPAVLPFAVMAISGKSLPIGEARNLIDGELRELEGELIPRVNQVVRSTEAALEQEEEKLSSLELGIGRLLEDLELDRSHISEIEERLQAIEEDLRQNQDSLKLRQLGSVREIELIDNRCPACHQPLRDSLLPQGLEREPMSLGENINFLKDQRNLFRFMEAQATRSISEKERQILVFRQGANEIRSRIRALKDTLISSGEEPSLAAVERKFRLRDQLDRIDRLKTLEEDFLGRLEELVREWREVEASRAQAPKEGLSEADLAKLADWEASVKEQLRIYDFSSVEISSLSLSKGNYQPMHEGFDLQFEISASDVVRVLWAYLAGLLEVARTRDTNHLGLLIADEPQQQGIAHESMMKFLRRAAEAGRFGQQVIVTTSAEEDVLEKELGDVPHTLFSFEGRILAKL